MKNDIYFYRANIPHVDTSKIFKISIEKEKFLRILDNKINIAIKIKLQKFDKIYNDFLKYLNLNFRQMKIKNKIYKLDKDEQDFLVKSIILHWIQYYTLNNLKIRIERKIFIHSDNILICSRILNRKYGEDTIEAMKLGAKIFRLKLSEYEMEIKYLNFYNSRR